ncbi:cupin domain-containing protein [Pseudorhodoplanes sp.]|uniref:cupin domain-containing protein n=1 Tax=Pseudorhodoplanes sp. TaxID=1934341 RepID=UPI00391A7B66
MSDFEQGITLVLGPEDGESIWQPKPSTGFIVNKINPYNSPFDNFSTGLQILEPGAHIRRHAHERQHEILFCYRGEGYAEIGEDRHELAEESMMLIGRGVQHKVVNTGTGQMRLLWIISPPGLEDWFRALGRLKQPGDGEAPVFERPANIAEIEKQQRFVRGID